MTGNKFGCVLQRAVDWCETVHKAEYNSSLSFQSNEETSVELDGTSVIKWPYCRMWHKWVFFTKQSGTAERISLRLFYAKYDTVA